MMKREGDGVIEREFCNFSNERNREKKDRLCERKLNDPNICINGGKIRIPPYFVIITPPEPVSIEVHNQLAKFPVFSKIATDSNFSMHT